jgi:FMN phosphatase YigB (HAD superfamily)
MPDLTPSSDPARPRIVLDAGGVLFTDGSDLMIQEIARRTGADSSELVRRYRADIHADLMRGDIAEDDFWEWAEGQTSLPADQHGSVRQFLFEEIMQQLPAVKRLPEWAESARLWILSNHRHEWLLGRLENAQVSDLFERVLISSEIRARKPERAAFEHLIGHDGPTVYVDDKQHNLDVAASVGCDTILADPDGAWIAELDAWLDRQGA